MVVIKIELWPKGNENKAREIGRMRVINDGTGNAQLGNYSVEMDHAGIYYGKRKNPWKTGKVKQHFRMMSPYHLLAKAVASCIGRVR